MGKIIRKLDDLCIRTIANNIERYSRTPKDTWKLRYCIGLGERLIYACSSISNMRLDENTFKFILNNFLVNRLKISSETFKNNQYFDILHEKFFDEIEFQLFSVIKLKNKDKKFQLTTNRLMLTNFSKNGLLAQSTQFFSNLHVKKEIIIYDENEDGLDDREMENVLIKLLENTSNDIEYVQIQLHKKSVEFIKKFIKIFNDRKNLRNLFINFDNKVPKLLRVFYLRINPATIYHHTCCSSSSSNLSFLDTGKFNDSLKSFHSIQKLNFRFENNENFDEIEELFKFLNELNLNNITEIQASSINIKYYCKYFNNFLENCPNLEKLKLTCFCVNDYNIFDTILPCSKQLKSLHLDLFRIDTEGKLNSFKNFLSHSSLQEIILKRISFGDGCFLQVVQHLEVLKNTLTSLTIDQCDIFRETIDSLPEVVEKLRKLKRFHFNNWRIENSILSQLFKSLQSSCHTLEMIYIYREYKEGELEDCSQLFNLLNNCEKLTTFYISLSISEKKFVDFLSILRKFQYILEEINFDFRCKKKFNEEIMDFVSKCTKLKKRFGYSTITDFENEMIRLP